MRARQQRRVDFEVRVLGGGADQDDQPVLDGGEQRVLLRLVEAMDLVEEENGPAFARARQALPCALDHRSHLGPARLDRALLLKRRIGCFGHQARQRRLAAARRPVQDHRVGMALLECTTERRSRGQEALLAYELIERVRPQPRGERSVRDGRGAARLLVFEQTSHE